MPLQPPLPHLQSPPPPSHSLLSLCCSNPATAFFAKNKAKRHHHQHNSTATGKTKTVPAMTLLPTHPFPLLYSTRSAACTSTAPAPFTPPRLATASRLSEQPQPANTSTPTILAQYMLTCCHLQGQFQDQTANAAASKATAAVNSCQNCLPTPQNLHHGNPNAQANNCKRHHLCKPKL